MLLWLCPRGQSSSRCAALIASHHHLHAVCTSLRSLCVHQGSDKRSSGMRRASSTAACRDVRIRPSNRSGPAMPPGIIQGRGHPPHVPAGEQRHGPQVTSTRSGITVAGTNVIRICSRWAKPVTYSFAGRAEGMSALRASQASSAARLPTRRNRWTGRNPVGTDLLLSGIAF